MIIATNGILSLWVFIWVQQQKGALFKCPPPTPSQLIGDFFYLRFIISSTTKRSLIQMVTPQRPHYHWWSFYLNFIMSSTTKSRWHIPIMRGKGGPERTTFRKLTVNEAHVANCNLSNGYHVRTSQYIGNITCSSHGTLVGSP